VRATSTFHAWTDADDELLLEEAERGTTAERIAKLISPTLSKSSVCGRKKRLLDALTEQELEIYYPNIARVWLRPKGLKRKKAEPDTKVRELPQILALPDEEPPTASPRVDELRAGMCKYPTHRGADNEWRMCGKKLSTTRLYCQGHRKVCFRPLDNRKKIA
jgi:hypothetical protein